MVPFNSEVWTKVNAKKESNGVTKRHVAFDQ